MNDKEEGEREAERRENGRRVSAMARRTGTEKRRKEINIVIKKNRVFKNLSTLIDFSSFANPISVFFLNFWGSGVFMYKKRGGGGDFEYMSV